MKRLLAATDLSSRSERALRRAAALSGLFGAELQLLHVVDGDRPTEVVEQESRQASALLERQAEALGKVAAARPSVAIRSGDPFEEIVAAAAEGEADLIVLGAHRKRILRDVFVGTTIERVIRTGHCPALMVNTELDGPYRRVMVAVDMSEASSNALAAAKRLGLFERAYVSLVHAFEPMAKGMMIYAGIERERIEEHVVLEAAETRKTLTSFLAKLDLGDTAFDVRLEDGHTFSAIQKVVEKQKPELLVIGTRGLTGAKRVLLGSVADAVLRGIECDILAVPPPVP